MKDIQQSDNPPPARKFVMAYYTQLTAQHTINHYAYLQSIIVQIIMFFVVSLYFPQ